MSGSSDPPGRAAPPTIRHHRRFALTDVTFADEPVGGATVDVWQDATGGTCWSARVLMPPGVIPEGGVLAGRSRDRGTLRGPVALVGPGPALRARGPVLVEWRGVGPLRADNPPGER
jgi:hypothetical protein